MQIFFLQVIIIMRIFKLFFFSKTKNKQTRETASYSVFRRFRQVKFADSGFLLIFSQFWLLLQRPLKMTLTIKLVKIDSKIIISPPWSKLVKHKGLYMGSNAIEILKYFFSLNYSVSGMKVKQNDFFWDTFEVNSFWGYWERNNHGLNYLQCPSQALHV